MDEMTRQTLEKEFEEKRIQLSRMMKQMERAQADYRRLVLARRARAVKEREKAAREETVRMEQALACCQQLHSNLNTAIQNGDPAQISFCESSLQAQKRSFELAQLRVQDACRRYQRELAEQGFPTEYAYQQALLTLPAQQQLENQIEPFRTQYAQLLQRCQELADLLNLHHSD